MTGWVGSPEHLAAPVAEGNWKVAQRSVSVGRSSPAKRGRLVSLPRIEVLPMKATTRSYALALAALTLGNAAAAAAPVSQLSAVARDGQVFLTWNAAVRPRQAVSL